MKQVFYIARIENRVFFIHKFSARGDEFISTVKMGLAYDRGGNASEAFKKALSRYGLEDFKTHLGSFDRMIRDLYVRHTLPSYDFSIKSPTLYNWIKEKALYIKGEEVDDAILLLQLEGYSIYNNKNELI